MVLRNDLLLLLSIAGTAAVVLVILGLLRLAWVLSRPRQTDPW